MPRSQAEVERIGGLKPPALSCEALKRGGCHWPPKAIYWALRNNGGNQNHQGKLYNWVAKCLPVKKNKKQNSTVYGWCDRKQTRTPKTGLLVFTGIQIHLDKVHLVTHFAQWTFQICITLSAILILCSLSWPSRFSSQRLPYAVCQTVILWELCCRKPEAQNKTAVAETVGSECPGRFFHSVSQSEAHRHEGEGICDHFAVNHITHPPTSAYPMEKDPVESRALAPKLPKHVNRVVIFSVQSTFWAIHLYAAFMN